MDYQAEAKKFIQRAADASSPDVVREHLKMADWCLLQALEDNENGAEREAAHPSTRHLYSSSNGDEWRLVCDPSGPPLVQHVPNRASGGPTTMLEVGAFLMQGDHPQQRELLRLIGTLPGIALISQ